MTTKLDRNNTNFVKELYEQFKKDLSDANAKKNPHEAATYSFLKYYQNVTRSYVMNIDIDSRGLLIEYEMGLGKSMIAVAIAVDMLKERQCIILLTKSLQENMYASIHKYVNMRREAEKDLPEDKKWPIGRLTGDALNDWIKHNFSFVSMNASNMLKQMAKASEGHGADEFDAALEKKMGEVVKLASLDGKLLIVDEAHNLFRAITNGSKNAMGLYDLVIRSKDLKILFLTGTPIANDPFELVPCFNMLGSKHPNVITFPEEYQEFYKLYVGEKGEIKNRNKFQNRIMGLVSKVDHNSTPGKAIAQAAPDGSIASSEIKVEFPHLNDIIVERIHMDTDQYMKYKLARDKEMQEGSGKFGPGQQRVIHHPPMIKPKSSASSSYRVKSRQLSNYCPPDTFSVMSEDTSIAVDKNTKLSLEEIPDDRLDSVKFRAIRKNIDSKKMDANRRQLGLVYSQFTGIGGLGTFARDLDVHGWSRFGRNISGSDDTYDSIDSTDNWIGGYQYVEKEGGGPALPSVDSYLANIEKEGGKIKDAWWLGGIDDDTNDNSNINDSLIDEATINDHDDRIGETDSDVEEIEPVVDVGTLINKSGKPIYALISGDVPVEERNRIKYVYNSSENAHGEIISLLLISSTGAEGLDLKGVRHIHIMEPYWNWGRVSQIISRGVRNDSHQHLPEDEKNVTAYIYLAIPPEEEKDPTTNEYPPTTDTELYDDSIANQIGIKSFVSAVDETSIECMINGEKNCRICNPDNKTLFSDDPARDIRITDPCNQLQEKTTIATEIIVNGIKYYYSPNPKSIYDYSIFVYDDHVDGYRPMKESEKLFVEIIDAINAISDIPEKEKQKG